MFELVIIGAGGHDKAVAEASRATLPDSFSLITLSGLLPVSWTPC